MKRQIKQLSNMQSNITLQELKQFAGQLTCFCPKKKNKGSGDNIRKEYRHFPEQNATKGIPHEILYHVC